MVARSRCSLFASALVAVATLLGSPTARAAGGAPRRGVRLAWARGARAEQCVGQLGLEEDVKARLGYDPFALAPELTIEGVVFAEGRRGFRAEWRVRDRAGREVGTRALTSRGLDCASLGEAVAVGVTLAIDPDAEAAREAPSVTEAPAPAPTEPAPRPAKRPVASERPRGRASLGATAQLGLVPGLAPGAALRALFAVGPRVEIGAGATYVAESQRGGVGFAMTTLSVDGCAVPFAALRLLRACAGVRGGAFHVTVLAPELAPLSVGAAPWLAVEAGPAAVVPLASSLALEARALATVPITRRQALLRGAPGELWEQSPVGGVAELALGVTF